MSEGDPMPSGLAAALELIGRRWTGPVLYALGGGRLYYNELRSAIPGVSDRLLSQRLRELEADGLVRREVHDGSPARVSYELSTDGAALIPVLDSLRDWADRRGG